MLDCSFKWCFTAPYNVVPPCRSVLCCCTETFLLRVCEGGLMWVWPDSSQASRAWPEHLSVLFLFPIIYPSLSLAYLLCLSLCLSLTLSYSLCLSLTLIHSSLALFFPPRITVCLTAHAAQFNWTHSIMHTHTHSHTHRGSHRLPACLPQNWTEQFHSGFYSR